MLRAAIGISAWLACLTCQAADGAVIYAIDDSGRGMTFLERLPNRSEPMLAVLTLYAMAGGTDCDHHDESGLRCALTTALGLGAQCSSRQLDAVSKAFPDAVPWLYRSYPAKLRDWREAANVEHFCYAEPDTASHQFVYTSIRINLRAGIVRVETDAFGYSQGDVIDVHATDTYRVLGNRVLPLRHRERRTSRPDDPPAS